MMFDKITASSLVNVDLDRRKLSDSPYAVNQAGFNIHSAVHAAPDDALCVIHTQSVNAPWFRASRASNGDDRSADALVDV